MYLTPIPQRLYTKKACWLNSVFALQMSLPNEQALSKILKKEVFDHAGSQRTGKRDARGIESH